MADGGREYIECPETVMSCVFSVLSPMDMVCRDSLFIARDASNDDVLMFLMTMSIAICFQFFRIRCFLPLFSIVWLKK